MKNFLNKFIISTATAATVSLCTLGSVAYADTTLALSSWLPPRHPIVAGAIKPWAKEIKKVTDGRVTVRVLAKPMGAPPAHYDMAQKGIADITYGLHSFTTDDRFVRSRIGQFSFLANDAVSGSKAFWEVYGNQLEAQKEHEGTKLLGLFIHGPGELHNNKHEIKSTDDLAGLKLRVPGGYVSELMANLGSTTLFMSTGEVYEKLTRGVIDGVTFPMDVLHAFKLSKNVKHTMIVPGGLYNTSWFLAMNEDKWNEISKEDQAAIEALSGAAFAERVGKAWDEADAKGIAAGKKDKVNVYDTPSSVLEAIKANANTLESEWVESIKADGYDGKAALEKFRALTAVVY
ncbi:TRAP transporter substrate-binding protein [Leucothrix mucor]|uniref:TRAP transporter substrate-binding protein n=1 Tax=Leucothrix mucor TaxID=45248 RepID=UPI0003B6E517|nr:TRAP transporter substrate-binding protein [Leucothrix mucor]